MLKPLVHLLRFVSALITSDVGRAGHSAPFITSLLCCSPLDMKPSVISSTRRWQPGISRPWVHHQSWCWQMAGQTQALRSDPLSAPHHFRGARQVSQVTMHFLTSWDPGMDASSRQNDNADFKKLERVHIVNIWQQLPK